MDVRNCAHCGRIYNYIFSPWCPECEKYIEQCLGQLRDYVYDHPNKTMSEVSEDTNIEYNIIRYLVEQERISWQGSTTPELTCGHCNRPISKGRYCNKCTKEIRELFDLKSQETHLPAEWQDFLGSKRLGRMFTNPNNNNK